MFLNQKREMLLETFFEKRGLNQMMFLSRFLGDLLLFSFSSTNKIKKIANKKNSLDRIQVNDKKKNVSPH